MNDASRNDVMPLMRVNPYAQGLSVSLSSSSEIQPQPPSENVGGTFLRASNTELPLWLDLLHSLVTTIGPRAEMR